MIQIRNGVFETNSSSTHSLVMCMKNDYDKWANREVYLNNEAGWSSYSEYKNKQFVTKEEAIDKLWPGREFNDNTKKLLNKAVNYIKDYMENRGIINFFYSTRAGCYINTEMVQCDYYDYFHKYGFDRVPVGYLEEFDWASKNY